MNGILNLDFMHYTTVISLEMSDEPRYNACVSPLSAENISNRSLHKIHKRPLRGWPRTNVRVAKET